MPLSDHLHFLESVGLLQLADVHPEVEYLFRHALIQDAAYTSLLRTDRRRLHLAVAEILEQFYPEQLDDLAPVLGQHFDEAGDQRALTYLTRAGDVAARRYALDEALLHYRRALALAITQQTPSAQLASLYRSCGRVLELSGQFEEALALYADLARHGQQRGDQSLRLAALLARATLHVTPTRVSDSNIGRAILDEALLIARQLADRPAEAKILWNFLLLNAFSPGSAEQAIGYGEASLAIARELDLREQLAYTLNDLAYPYMNVGRYQQANAALSESRGLWRELGNLPMLADNLIATATRLVLAGDLNPALVLLDEAYQVSRSIGNHWGESNSLWSQAQVYAELGDFGRAIALLHEAIALGDSSGFLGGSVAGRSDLAMYYTFLGAARQGQDLAQQALQKAIQQRPEMRGLALAILAWAHLRLNDVAGTESLVAELAHYQLQDDFYQYCVAFLVLSDIWLAQRRYDEMIVRADEFYNRLRQYEIQIFLSDALITKGQALLLLGQLEAAQAVLLEAQAWAKQQGTRRNLWQILGLLSQVAAQRGDQTSAHQFRRQAQEVVAYIATHLASPDLYNAFLNLPAVKALGQQY
jgi:tetratricopeptide (TPR) repeat protein